MPKVITTLSASEWEKDYYPDKQREYARNEVACIMEDSLTLTEMDLAFGEGFAESWLISHLFNLSEYCGSKVKLTDFQLDELSSIIFTDYHHLKVKELMLFFYKFKKGKYGKFYGTIDPTVITNAIPEFLKERSMIIDRIEQEKMRQERKSWAETSITYEEYLRRKANNPEIGQN